MIDDDRVGNQRLRQHGTLILLIKIFPFSRTPIKVFLFDFRLINEINLDLLAKRL